MLIDDVYDLGLLILVIGAAFILVTYLALRRMPKIRTRSMRTPGKRDAALGDPKAAALVVQEGGRLVEINELARQMFHIPGGQIPDLERLARQIKPTELFLELCGQEGQAKFVFEDKVLEGNSFSLLQTPRPIVVVSLRALEMATVPDAADRTGAFDVSSKSLFPQDFSASLDLQATIQQAFANLKQVIPSDIMEITLWDAERSELEPYYLIGASDAGDGQLQVIPTPYRLDEGYSGYLARTRKPLLVPNATLRSDIRPAQHEGRFPLRSYLGVPLVVGDEFVGTMELASLSKDAFQPSDLPLLQMVSGRVANALRNAAAYRKEQTRSRDLAAVMQLSAQWGAAGDTPERFSRLVEGIAALIPVNVLGFLLYDESRCCLVGRAPFHGLTGEQVAGLCLPVQPGSSAAAVFSKQDIIIGENADKDTPFVELGFSRLAESLGLHDTVLIPLVSGARHLGYLLAANHPEHAAVFMQDELHLLAVAAGQVAPLVENSMLAENVQQHDRNATALYHIAGLSSSAAGLEEQLKYSLRELADLLDAEAAAVFLLDGSNGELGLHAASIFGNFYDPEVKTLLKVDDPQFPLTVTGSKRPLVFDVNGSENHIPPCYESIVSRWKVASAAVVPLVVGDERLGELWLCSSKSHAFDQGDVRVLTTAAGQLANAMKHFYLSAQSDSSLRRRVQQLTALTRIGRALSNSLDLKPLLELVYEEMLHTTQADCGTIMLFDLNRPASEQGYPQFVIGDKLPAEIPQLVWDVLKSGEVLNLPDVAQTEYHPLHSGVRSALLVPVIYHDFQAGLIELHSTTINRFDASAVEIVRSLSSQAAFALGNAMQYEEQLHRGELLKRELETLTKLSQVSHSIGSGQSLEDSLAAICNAISDVTPFQVVLMSLCDPDGTLQRVYNVGLSTKDWQELHTHTQAWTSMEKLLKPEFRLGGVYFIPADKLPVVPADIHTVTVLSGVGDVTVDTWDPDDMLLAPFYDSEGKPLGLISVDAPRDNHRPDRATYDALELFTIQAGLIVDSHYKERSLQAQVTYLEEQLDRLDQAASNANASFQVLLHRDLEQTVAIHSLQERLARIQSGMEITEQAAAQTEPEMVLQVTAKELLTRFDLEFALVAENSKVGPQLLQVLGSLPSESNTEVLFGQRNPLRQVLGDGKLILVSDLEQQTAWQAAPLLTNLGTRSFIALPFRFSDQLSGGILAISQKPMAPFDAGDRQIFDHICHQISISLQNLSLLSETQGHLQEVNLLLEFSHDLSSLDPNSILKSLLQTALTGLPLFRAGWVALATPDRDRLEIQVAKGYPDSKSLLGLHFELPKDESELEKAPLPVRVWASGTPEETAEVDFVHDYDLPVEELVRYQKATNGRLPVSSLVVPLKIGDTTMGVIVVDNFDAAKAFEPEDKTLLLSLSQQAALGLENARLYAETRQLTEDLERRVEQRTAELSHAHQNTQTLLRISTELSASLDLPQVLQRTLKMVHESTGAEQSLILLAGHNRVDYLAGMPLVQSKFKAEILPVVNWVQESREPLLASDIQEDARWQLPKVKSGYHSVLAIPLTLGDQVLGTLLLRHHKPSCFQQEQAALLIAASRQISITLNNAELFQLVRQQAENLSVLLKEQQVETGRSRAILEAVADGVLVTDSNNLVILFNASAEHMLGIVSDQVVGKPLKVLVELAGKEMHNWSHIIQNWAEDGTVTSREEVYAAQHHLENGAIVSVHLAPVILDDKFYGTVSIFRDVTTEVQVDQLKSEFIASVSHELRTPMTSIKGYVDVMLMEAAGPVNDQQKHFLEIVKANTQRLGVLVNDLLDTSRIESGRMYLSLQAVDLAEIARGVLDDIRRRSGEEGKPMSLFLEAPDGLPRANGDKERIRQVMSTLALNSYNYTPPGGKITVRISQIDSELQVDVQDNGVGLSAKDELHIFERFYRGDDPLVVASAGAGLGLVIARTLVEMHRGRIWFKSNGVSGEGATFSFTLPVH
jgi:PAS domain S-box-containing protein